MHTPPPPPKAAPDAPKIAEHRFPCDACGADLRFAPGADMLICGHCGNRQTLSTSAAPIVELDLQTALNAELPDAEMEVTRVSQCHNCGAEVEFDAALHAAECPFCATPVVTDTGQHRHIKPRGVLPFSVDDAMAGDAMKDWLGSLWFAPSGLQDYARKGRKMQGIYVPFWTFDARTSSRYQGARGTIYYVTRTVMRDGKPQQIQVPKTRWRNVSGRVSRFFDDVLVIASRSLPKAHTDALAPWDLTALHPYAPEFLAGFRAEGYAVSLSDGFTEARAIMDRTITRDVKFDIGGDRQKVHNIQTEMRDVTFKHVLLPVWLAAYKFRGKTYRFVVNGQSGRVQGERPYSAMKIACAVIAGAIIAAGVGYLAAQGQ